MWFTILLFSIFSQVVLHHYKVIAAYPYKAPHIAKMVQNNKGCGTGGQVKIQSTSVQSTMFKVPCSKYRCSKYHVQSTFKVPVFKVPCSKYHVQSTMFKVPVFKVPCSKYQCSKYHVQSTVVQSTGVQSTSGQRTSIVLWKAAFLIVNRQDFEHGFSKAEHTSDLPTPQLVDQSLSIIERLDCAHRFGSFGARGCMALLGGSAAQRTQHEVPWLLRSTRSIWLRVCCMAQEPLIRQFVGGLMVWQDGSALGY